MSLDKVTRMELELPEKTLRTRTKITITTSTLTSTEAVVATATSQVQAITLCSLLSTRRVHSRETTPGQLAKQRKVAVSVRAVMEEAQSTFLRRMVPNLEELRTRFQSTTTSARITKVHTPLAKESAASTPIQVVRPPGDQSTTSTNKIQTSKPFTTSRTQTLLLASVTKSRCTKL